MRQGYYMYKENRPSPSGLPAIVGKIFHQSIHYVVHHGYDPEIATYASVYEHNGLPEGENMAYMIQLTERAYDRVLDMQSEYAELTSELHVLVEIAPGIEVQAYLDIIVDDPSADELIISDFKTSWVSYAANKTHQLRLYGLLFKILRGYVPSVFKGKLIFPRLSKEEDQEIVFTDEMLEETRQWALNVIKAIEEAGSDIHKHPMTTNKRNCELCPYVNLCASDYLEHIPAAGLPSDHIEAELIGEYLVLQELTLKRMKEGLKEYVKGTDAVATTKGTWEFKSSEPSPKIDIQALKGYADLHHIDFLKLVNIDSKKLKELIENDATGELQGLVKYTNPRQTFVFTTSSEDDGFYDDEAMSYD